MEYNFREIEAEMAKILGGEPNVQSFQTMVPTSPKYYVLDPCFLIHLGLDCMLDTP